MTTKRKKDDVEIANAVFHNTSAGRAVFSKKFNFIYDNESGAAITYGETAGDTPKYDPIGPQEYVIETSDFELNNFKNMFNMIAVAKEISDEKTPIAISKDSNEEKLVSMSTISNIILKISDIVLLANADFKEYIRYIQLFKLNPVLMIDLDAITEKAIFAIKDLGTNISIIITIKDNFNDFEKISESLKIANIFYSVKIFVSADNSKEVKDFIENKISNDISTILTFTEPYVNRAVYREIQQLCLDKGLTNAAISSCHLSQFNKRANNTLMLFQKCSAGTYSAYIKEGKISPCEYFTTNFVDLSECKTVHDFWYHKFFTSVRKTISNDKSCKH